MTRLVQSEMQVCVDRTQRQASPLLTACLLSRWHNGGPAVRAPSRRHTGLRGQQCAGASFLAQVSPLGASIPLLVGMLGVISIIATGRQDAFVFDTEAGVSDGRLSIEYYPLWLAGLMVISAVVGFVTAAAIFFALFVRVNASAPLGRTAIFTASAVLFLALMSYVFVLDFPVAYLHEAVEMPWPFR